MRWLILDLAVAVVHEWRRAINLAWVSIICRVHYDVAPSVSKASG